MSTANHVDGVVTQTTGVDQAGRALVPVTIGDTTLPAGSTPQQRFEAILKAGIQPTQGGFGHTSATVARLQDGDAAAKIDQKALGALKDQFGKLTARDRETHRVAFESDLKSVSDGQAPKGVLKAAIAKAERDQRTRDALNVALQENKSPAELQQIIEAAATGTPKGEQVHITGTAALALLEEGFGKLPQDQQRAMQKQFERDYAAIRADGYAIRSTANGVHVYDPTSSSEVAGQARDASGRFVPPQGTPAERQAGEEWKKPSDVAKATAELAPHTTAGFVPISKLTLRHTSGYTLPAAARNMTFQVSALELLAQARAAGIPQEQVTAILNEQMRAHK